VTGCRFREDTGFEGKCDRCLSWWPISREFWSTKQGMKRCRACLSEITNERNRIRRSDPAVRAAEAEAMRVSRRAKASDQREYWRNYYREKRDRINELARERYARRGVDPSRRAYKREWMRQYRSRQADLAAEMAA
jgi:hypothetical protein